MPRAIVLESIVFFAFVVIATNGWAQSKLPDATRDAPANRFEFTRIVAHWAKYNDDQYLPFIEAAQPDLVQLGFYGGHYWSLAHTPQFAGYPSHFPVQGLSECRSWFRQRNAALHQRNTKVVGHFNVEFLVGDPKGSRDANTPSAGPSPARGFFHFYENLWDEELLGPRPVNDPRDLLERNGDGTLVVNQNYSIGGMKEYWACLRNPNWQRVLKAWVKHGVDQGLDGFIANYFYRHNCLCEHCQRGFRKHLTDGYSAAQLRERFNIRDINAYQFDELVAWHDPEESSPLRLEMLRWSQISNKAVFDEVFVRYGRSLKKDLLVAQWNHLSNFSQINGDERCLLPAELWGKDEDYLWYSIGAAANYTDLAEGFFGDATLQARYIRGAFDDKPFTLGKYENTRIRAAISELAANGGAPMGFYTRFTDPVARQVIVQYYQFLKKHDAVYRGNTSHAEVLLMFPRSFVHQGDLTPLERFRQLGKRFLDEHILFDVIPDDICDDATRDRYATVLSVGKNNSTDILKGVKGQLSQFSTKPAVRVSASRPANGGELTLHFVNYNRTEPPQRNGRPSPGGGVVDEKPIAANPVGIHFVLPKQFEVTRVEFTTPENPDPKAVPFHVTDGVLQCETPAFLVYGVLHLIRQP